MAFRKIKGHQRKTTKNQRSDRNREIYQLYLEKRDEMSLDDIGKQYGLTRGRICQIVKRQAELALAEEAER